MHSQRFCLTLWEESCRQVTLFFDCCLRGQEMARNPANVSPFSTSSLLRLPSCRERGKWGRERERERGRDREGGREGERERESSSYCHIIKPLFVSLCPDTCSPVPGPWPHAVSVWNRDCHSFQEHWKTVKKVTLFQKKTSARFHHFLQNFWCTFHRNEVGVAR